MARTEIMYVAGGSGGERGRQRPRPVRDAMCRVRSTELAIIRVTPRRDTGVTAASGGRYLGITLPSPPPQTSLLGCEVVLANILYIG